ncbi:MAG TPA: hypothetical protein VGK78_09455 [Nocardioides sp.]|uniref:hypothetical protein n=1 Tax=Nocardioides sp. TaxID=35761 RepID=UPI002F3E6DDF
MAGSSPQPFRGSPGTPPERSPATSHTPTRASGSRGSSTAHPTPGARFPGGHFHTGEELEAELTEAGLTEVRVIGIEGPAGFALEVLPDPSAEVYDAALTLARAVGHLPGIRDLSTHLLASARVL